MEARPQAGIAEADGTAATENQTELIRKLVDQAGGPDKLIELVRRDRLMRLQERLTPDLSGAVSLSVPGWDALDGFLRQAKEGQPSAEELSEVYGPAIRDAGDALAHRDAGRFLADLLLMYAIERLRVG
jgi:hypothetical protein